MAAEGSNLGGATAMVVYYLFVSCIVGRMISLLGVESSYKLMAGGTFIFLRVEQPGFSSKFTNKKIGRISTGGSTGYTTYITKIPRKKLMIYLNRYLIL